MTNSIPKPALVNLKKLVYSPDHNPLMEPATVATKRRYVRAGRSKDLVDPLTGELTAVSTVHTVEEKDDANFVKIFAAGMAAAYDLNKTAMRVFQAVLHEYERAPMRSGFAEFVELSWFDDGLCGRTIEMSEKTFQRGLKELLAFGFIAPRTPNTFWVNPALFFKGDRVRFVKEYRRKRESESPESPQQELLK